MRVRTCIYISFQAGTTRDEGIGPGRALLWHTFGRGSLDDVLDVQFAGWLGDVLVAQLAGRSGRLLLSEPLVSLSEQTTRTLMGAGFSRLAK